MFRCFNFLLFPFLSYFLQEANLQCPVTLNPVFRFLLMLQDVGLLIIAFGSPQDFKKCTNTLVNGIIENFVMHIINFDMLLLKVGIE